MAGAKRLDSTIFLRGLGGVALGAAVAVALNLWVIPGAADYRPAVVSTIVVPLGCFLGWLLSPSRERAPAAAVVCFALYFLSAFAAARLGTLTQWDYYHTIVGVQGLAGLGLALYLGFAGRALPEVERLSDARDVAGLAAVLQQGTAPERLEAVRALGNLGGVEVRPALLVALDDGDERVRYQAVTALTGLATEADVPRLAALLECPEPRVRRRVLEVLRWVEGETAKKAIAAYWRRVLSADGGRLWLQALPLGLGVLLLLVSLAFPWGSAGEAAPRLLWRLDNGIVFALLLAGSALLPLAELLWGMGRRSLAGHLDRLRIWAFLPLAVLVGAMVGPLQGTTALAVQGWAALGVGLGVAAVGAAVELLGGFVLRG